MKKRQEGLQYNACILTRVDKAYWYYWYTSIDENSRNILSKKLSQSRVERNNVTEAAAYKMKNQVDRLPLDEVNSESDANNMIAKK
jgi:hypothetical protein